MDLRSQNVCPRCGERVERRTEAPWKHLARTDCTFNDFGYTDEQQLTLEEAA